MGKRGNENGQMRKGDYEAAVQQSQDDTTGGQMQRADDEVLQQRRVVRARQVAPAAAATDQASTGTGLFAKINLTAGAPSSTGFSFSSFAPAPAAPAPATTDTASQAASGFTFGASSALTVATSSAIATNALPAPSANLEGLEKEREQDLLNDHENFLTSTDTYQKEQIVHKMFRDIRKWKQIILDAERSTAPSAASLETNASSTAVVVAPAPETTSTAITCPAVSTGGFSFGAASAPTPSSGVFSFGAASNPAAAASSAPSNGAFSFGAASTPTAASSAPSSGSFSFGVAPAMQSALTSPVSTAASLVSSNQHPPADDGEPSDEIPKNQSGAVVQEVADPDWDDVGSFEPVTFYRNENGKWKPLLSKTRLRLQTSKTDASRHRMVARDAMGKPLVNMSIQSGMGFTFAEQASKRGPYATILFMGTNDAEKGPEKFNIKIQVAEGNRLHQKLNELCSK